MTTAIYILGDLTLTHALNIYDAHTDKTVNNVEHLTIDVDANRKTKAMLHFMGPGPSMAVDVVAAPPDPLAGKKVVAFSMESKHNPKLCATVQHAKAEEYTVQDDGTLGAASVHENSAGVTDLALFSYAGADPLDPITDSMTSTLRGLAALVIHDIVAGALANIIPAPVFAVPKTGITKTPPICEECFGTGLKSGFMAPCSKGCKQP